MSIKMVDIHRQHAETTVPELHGKTCNGLLAAGYLEGPKFTHFYLSTTEDQSFRFFIDVGVLFWDPSQPDAYNDVDGECAYFDLLDRFDLLPSTIREITMKAGILRIGLGDKTLVFREDEDETTSVTLID